MMPSRGGGRNCGAGCQSLRRRPGRRPWLAWGLRRRGGEVDMRGRSEVEGQSKEAHLAGSLERTAEECNTSGGKCIPHVCDHRDDARTRQVFREILDREQRIDILVNSV